MRIREVLRGWFPLGEWRRLRAHSGGCCTCCGYREVLTVDRAPDGPVRGLVCRTCRVGLDLIDAGQAEPVGCYSDYLANPWRPSRGTQGR